MIRLREQALTWSDKPRSHTSAALWKDELVKLLEETKK